MKSTKRVFFLSVMSVLLCVAMLAGTTFAWFTDSEASGVNKIIAGNLDIALEYSKNGTDWISVAGTTDLFSDVTLWEPGTTAVVYLKLTNKGTLALKYNLAVTATGGDFINVEGQSKNLKDALKFAQIAGSTLVTYANRDLATAATASAALGLADYAQSNRMSANDVSYITLVVTMPADIDNAFNYKTGTAAPTISLGITLQATQYTAESDSFDEKYDIGTSWMGSMDAEGLTANTDTSAKTVKIESAEQLAAFASACKTTSFAGYTVTLEKDIDLNNIAWTPITYTNNDGMVFDGKNHTILHLNASGTKYVGLFGAATGVNIKNVKLKDVTLRGVAYAGAVVGSIYGEVSNCHVENVTITMNGALHGTVYEDGAKAGAIVGMLREEAGEKILNCSAKNVVINGYRDLGGIVGCVYGPNTVTGNTIENVTVNQGEYSQFEDADYTTLGAIYGRKIVSADAPATGTIQDNTGDATIHTATVATPATAQAVLDAAQNGDTIYFKTGSYAQLAIDHTIDGLTLKAVEGVDAQIAGVSIATACNTTSKTFKNIVFDGLTFTAKTDINSSNTQSVIDGVTFKNCVFNIGTTAEDNQAIRFYNENNDGNVRNLTVENCTFNTCYQGVYTANVNGITVKNCTFDTTGHNAIAIQSTVHGAVNHKAVVITGNTFKNIGDRIMRFGDVAADTQITIQNNTATNSGDSDNQVIKATTLAEGITYAVSGNNWGEGKIVVNDALKDQ